MTATAAAAENTARDGLPDDEPDDVAERAPARDAPEDRGDEFHVQGPLSLRGRVHDVTVLSLIVLIQVTWIGALAYGIWLLA